MRKFKYQTLQRKIKDGDVEAVTESAITPKIRKFWKIFGRLNWKALPRSMSKTGNTTVRSAGN